MFWINENTQDPFAMGFSAIEGQSSSLECS